MKMTSMMLLIVLLPAVFSMPQQHETKGFLDNAIAKLIESIKPSLVNMTLTNVNSTMNQTGILVHLETTNVTVYNLDSFIELQVNTTLIPLRLDNITLFWEEFFLIGEYGLNGLIDLDGVTQGPVDLNGSGALSATLRSLTLTGAADFAMQAGKLQITELYGLGVALESSTITLENLFGGGDLENVLNVFFSFFVPQLVNDQGTAILESLSPVIKDLLNEILAELL